MGSHRLTLSLCVRSRRAEVEEMIREETRETASESTREPDDDVVRR